MNTERPPDHLSQRPVIAGFHPDPSICRVGQRFYLATSSFEYAPGIPVFTSEDLRTWELVGHVMHRREQFDPQAMWPSGGFYAPTLRHHDDLFWVATTNDSGPAGQLIVTAADPAGPWSNPTYVPDAIGIDPDLAWDEGGTCWMSWSGRGSGGRHAILQAPVDTDNGQLLRAPSEVWGGTGGQFPEGPHLYRHAGWWYLLIAEGGTERGHAATLARAAAPDGPFSPAPHNPLLSAASTDLPVQSTGHADLVQRADGSWAVVYLGTRPRGASPGWHVMGRETFASQITWRDGWPVLSGAIEPRADAAFVEVLNTELPRSWTASGCWPGDLLHYDGQQWILASGGLCDGFVGRRQAHPTVVVQTRLAPSTGSRGGLQLRIDPLHAVTVWADSAGIRATHTVGGRDVELGRAPHEEGVMLELRTQPSASRPGTTKWGPDDVVVGMRSGNAFAELGRVDGRYLSTEIAGGFTGRMVGLVVQGQVVVESFAYRQGA